MCIKCSSVVVDGHTRTVQVTPMSSGGAAGSGSMVPTPVDDLEAAPPAVEPWPWRRGTNKVCQCHRFLLPGSLMTTLLLLLSFFVLRPESPSPTAWLHPGLTTTATNAPAPHGRDELLGGLLPAGMDRRSCRSRYESWRYYKYFPYVASPYLQRKLREYEAKHRRCAPGTPLYAKAIQQLRSGRSADDVMECNYIVWLPFDGLGNRMLSMVSAFLYALLTNRVLLAALPPDSADLFCEPFPGTTWRLPVNDDFPVADLVPQGQNIDKSYTRLLDAANATKADVPAYVYLSLGWQLKDPLFFCGEHQRVLGKFDWLLLYSDLYFAPSLYAVAESQDELRRMLPAAKESVSHLLSRYLFQPTNTVWSLATRYYRSYLESANRRIGVQIRMFSYGSISADDMYSQILACSRQEHVLLETDDGAGGDEVAAGTTMADDGNNGDGSNSNSTAILVASLYADYYERLRSRYYEHAAKGGEAVAVFQPSHEGRQATGDIGHNQRALAEIYLLSFCEELLTSGRSTFGYVSSSLAGVRPTILLTAYGHKVPEPPCRRAVSMEPCNLTPPLGVECRGSKTVDKDDLARHLKVCEDSKDSVKFFD